MLGSTSYENMTITLNFDRDGQYGGLDSIREEAVEMGHFEALAVWFGLTELERDVVKDLAWEDASLSAGDDVDDAGVEEEREAS